jgi:hypothetical protein
MRKGFTDTVSLLMSIILLMSTVALFWYSWSMPKDNTLSDETDTNTVQCKTSNDCADSPYGSKCILVYPSDYEDFCGCATNEDCAGRGGEACGFDNRCA